MMSEIRSPQAGRGQAGAGAREAGGCSLLGVRSMVRRRAGYGGIRTDGGIRRDTAGYGGIWRDTFQKWMERYTSRYRKEIVQTTRVPGPPLARRLPTSLPRSRLSR